MSQVSLKGKNSGKGSSSKIPRPTSAGKGAPEGSMYKMKPLVLPQVIEPPQGMYRVSPASIPCLEESNSGTFSCSSSTSVGKGVPEGSMYKMKPVILPQVIELPQGMYRVSPVSVSFLEESNSGTFSCSSTGSISSKPSKVADSIDPVSVEKFRAIEKRQVEILEKLKHLREMIVGIHDTYEVEVGEGMSRNVLGVQEYVDIVVNANPKKAPFSILFLYKLLREYYGEGVRLHNHVHSSVNEPLPSYLTIFNKPEDNTCCSPTIILVTLIWKEIDEAELIVNPSDIRGEGNIAKFLSQLIPPVFPLNYDTLDPNTRSLVDGFIFQALNEQTFNLEMVENYFKGRNNANGFSLLTDGISIADYITYAAVARHLLKDLHSINLRKHPLLMQWLTTCQHYGEFELFTGDN